MYHTFQENPTNLVSATSYLFSVSKWYSWDQITYTIRIHYCCYKLNWSISTNNLILSVFFKTSVSLLQVIDILNFLLSIVFSAIKNINDVVCLERGFFCCLWDFPNPYSRSEIHVQAGTASFIAVPGQQWLWATCKFQWC